MDPTYGEPPSAAQIEAETQRQRDRLEAETKRALAREETRRSRHYATSVVAGITGATLVVLGVIGAIMQGHNTNAQEERAKAAACVAAGGAWTENSSSEFECRRG